MDQWKQLWKIEKENVCLKKLITIKKKLTQRADSLPKPASPQNLLYGRHIESELGIDVMTILECFCGKEGRCNLWITDCKSV